MKFPPPAETAAERPPLPNARSRGATRSERGDALRDEWAERLRREVRRYCSRRSAACDADPDDIAQEQVVRFLQQPEHFMARYESPEALGRAMAKNGKLNWERGQRVQRGQGGALVTTSSGGRRVARTVESADRPVGSGTFDRLIDRIADRTADVEAAVLEGIERTQLGQRIGAAFAALGPDDRYILCAVHAEGIKRSDVRRHFGCSKPALRQREKRARDRFIAAYR